MRFRERLASFFHGRYGVDELSRFLLVIYLALAVIMLFVRNSIVYYILQGLSLALCIWMFFRMLSRNIAKRSGENAYYQKLRRTMREKILLSRNKWKYRKTHVYRKCPNCGVQVKLRRVAGDHRCACPKCGEDFAVHVK